MREVTNSLASWPAASAPRLWQVRAHHHDHGNAGHRLSLVVRRSLKMLKRNILGFMGVAPIRSTIYGMIEGVSAETRRRWLRDVEELGRDAA
jgi:hypothetical protein